MKVVPIVYPTDWNDFNFLISIFQFGFEELKIVIDRYLFILILWRQFHSVISRIFLVR
jgi:hypothetical protein